MKWFLFLASICFLHCRCQSQPATTFPDECICRIMFWNSENLFDCFNDSTVNDDEFLPHGIRNWNAERYWKKLNNMYKVFIAAGEWQPPDIIGLCEVENKKVLFDLTRNTPFSYYNYHFIHYDSPDRRGIDVVLLYNPATIEVICDKAIPVILPADTSFHTRDILCARLKIYSGDSLLIFVNHWPSKYGGAGITADSREAVAEILAQNIQDSILVNHREKIIVMGDFNDPPESSSLEKLRKTLQSCSSCSSPLLVNLSMNYKCTIPGSYKFGGTWQLIDQVLVSENLISGEENMVVRPGSFRVFSTNFLLEKDEKFGGSKPFRTYTGISYHGGYSDHLPVILDLFPAP